MLKMTTFTLAALAASPVLAQNGPQPAPAAPAGATQAANPPSNAQSLSPTGAPQAAAAPTNTSAQVAAVVNEGFPKYDKDGDGKLSAAEFKQWISDLKTQEMAAQGKPADANAVTQYANSALASADKDKDGVITRQDLTSFLGG